MLSLRDYLVENDITKAGFAQLLESHLGRRVPKQSLNRWTLPSDDPGYSIPRKAVVEAIELATNGAVAPGSWYVGGAPAKRRSRSPAISSAASRKGWKSRRAQAAAR